MWNVEPKKMCRNHLLGEHKEIHQLLGSMKAGRSIQGHIDKKQVDPSSIIERHNELVFEMLDRGYNHNSNLSYKEKQLVKNAKSININSESNLQELKNRCNKCRKRIE